jgi:predicted NAD/FAD-binding protein
MGALGRRTDRPKHLWWYIGSKYKKPFVQDFEQHGGKIRYNSIAKRVEKGGKSVLLTTGEKISCDHVVLACHADESAALIPWSEEGVKSLNRFYFHKSMMYIHRDPSFLPPDNKVWSSWNVKITKNDEYILTYWMNRIQRLKSKQDVFVTITPHDFKGQKPKEELTIKAFRWDHPRLLADCIPQDQILQEEGITLSGAWLGRGFHEDGFVAGRRAAAIVKDSKHTKTPLYEDPGNIPVPTVPPFDIPIGFKLVGLSIGGVVTYGIVKLVTKFT